MADLNNVLANTTGGNDSYFYKTIMEQAQDIILVVNSLGGIIDANQAAIKAYGYSPEELRNLRVHELRSPETRAMVDDQLRIAQLSGTLFRTVHIRRSGERFAVEVSSRRVKLPDEEVVVSIIRDITLTVAMEISLQENEAKFRKLHEELMFTHEELTASEEELRQQFDELLAKQEQLMKIQEALKISETKYRAIFATANDGIFVHDMETGDIIDANPKACSLYTSTPEEIITKNFTIIGTGEAPYSEKEAKFWIKQAATGRPQLFEWQIKRKNDSFIWVEVNLKRVQIGDEDRILAIIRDISERKQNELELRKSQASNQALVAAIPDMMFVIKKDGTFTEYKASREHPELASDIITGKTAFDVYPPDIAAKMLREIIRTIETGETRIFEYELTIRSTVEHYEVRIVPSDREKALAIVRNITDRKRLEERLKQLSIRDALTGLYNRAFFEESMNLSEDSNNCGGLIICDVDGLKIINDTLGHQTGDETLKAVAEILKKSVTPNDIVARIGGDEFAILLSTKVIKVFETYCRRIYEHVGRFNCKNPTVPISLSMGFAVAKAPTADMRALFKEADNNMYRKKLHRHTSARSSLVQALMKALEARDFITEGHGARLQNQLALFAATIGFADYTIADLKLLARFHDIGKVGIPDSILFKPSKLSDDEMAIMRKHCEIGYRIAKSSPDLSPIADWILKHQEWWNGKGYPLGLKGEAIPLECRILSIIDAFDAMTNDRPYRKAMPENLAIAELKRCAGTQFDPLLVQKFIDFIPNLKTAD